MKEKGGERVDGLVRSKGERKVRPEKRRRVNGGGLRAPGSRAMEPRRFIGVARDGGGEGEGVSMVHVLCPILHGERTLSSAASGRAKTSLVS